MLELRNTNWENILNDNNIVNTNFTLFQSKLTQILNNNIPKKCTKITTKNKKSWLSKGLKISCRHKRLLQVLVKKTNNNKIIKELLFINKYKLLLIK